MIGGRRAEAPSSAAAVDEHAKIAIAAALPYARARRLLAEFVGTFALTIVAAGTGVVSVLNHGTPDFAAQVVAPGLLVVAMIYSIGPTSGAHLNPVVTLAFALRRDFPWSRLPGYWATQIVGALLAAAVLRAMFGNVGHLGATLPHSSFAVAVLMETMLTAILVSVILATASYARIVGPNAALAVGGTIAMAGFLGGKVSGASMNPARSLGPAFVNGNASVLWIYVVGPLAGCVIAVGLAWLLRGPTNPDAMAAAVGSE